MPLHPAECLKPMQDAFESGLYEQQNHDSKKHARKNELEPGLGQCISQLDAILHHENTAQRHRQSDQPVGLTMRRIRDKCTGGARNAKAWKSGCKGKRGSEW